MKKITYILTTLSLFALSACNSFLSEKNPNGVPSEDYFSNETDVEKAVNGIYLAIRSNSCLGESSYIYSEERSDNMGRADETAAAGEPFQFGNYGLLPSNSYVRSHWNALFAAVSRTNFVLSNIDDVTFTNASLKINFIAEAKFVRALCYFHLVRKWGDVPLVTKHLVNYSDIIEHTFRVKKELVYNQIVLDLKEALNSSLPNIQPPSGKGRACKAAINGLLGEVYLTMGCVLSSNQTENLQNAKKYLLDCWGMKSFTTISSIPYAEVFNVETKNSNPEAIFQIVYKQGDIAYYSSNASDFQSKGETINSQKKAAGAGNMVRPDIVQEFEEGDIRKDFTIKYANDPSAKAYFICKFRDTSDAAGPNGYGGNDHVLMRYADIALLLAETHMRLGEENEAISYLDDVRARAGLPTYTESKLKTDYATKYPTLKLAILHERRSELAFEQKRWNDLTRTFTPTELVAYITSKDNSSYGNANPKNFGLKDIYYPIPFDECKLNPEKMYQNEGY